MCDFKENPENVLLMLTIEVDEDATEFAQEWMDAYARNARRGLRNLGYEGKIVLTSSDGIHEIH